MSEHTHIVRDDDTRFTLNTVTRKLISGSAKKTLVQGSHNCERFTFEFPRYIEEHDMSLCNAIQVHYNNIEVKTKNTSADVYECSDMEISGDTITFSWLISKAATKYNGSLNFIITLKCITNGTLDYAYVTEIYDKISISAGIDNGEAADEVFSDILSSWKAEVLADVNSEVGRAETAATNASSSATQAAQSATQAASSATAAQSAAQGVETHADAAAASASQAATSAQNAATSAQGASASATSAASSKESASSSATAAASSASSAATSASNAASSATTATQKANAAATSATNAAASATAAEKAQTNAEESADSASASASSASQSASSASESATTAETARVTASTHATAAAASASSAQTSASTAEAAANRAETAAGNTDIGDHNTSTTAHQNLFAGKLDKISLVSPYDKVYGINKDGSQATIPISKTVSNNSLVWRDTGGVIEVGTPTEDGHAATKAYVDGIEIGGRNLIKGTSDAWADISVLRYAGTLISPTALSEFGLTAGEQVTFSVDIKTVAKSLLSARLDFCQNADGTGVLTFISATKIANGTNGVSSVTATVPNGYGYLRAFIFNENDSVETETTTEQYRRLKLERGNKRTDWQSANEDKLDRVTSTHTHYRAYGVTNEGQQLMYNVSSGAVANALVSRDANGRFELPAPSADNNPTTKAYVDALINALDGQLGEIKYIELTGQTDTDTYPIDTIKRVWETLELNSVYVAKVIRGSTAIAIIQKHNVHTYGAVLLMGYGMDIAHYRLQDGEWTFIKYSINSNNIAGVIPVRDAAGTFMVSAPTDNQHPATKKYVDDNIPTVPTKTSQLTNDSGFLTEIPDVDLTGYATEQYVDDAVAGIDIPETDISGKLDKVTATSAFDKAYVVLQDGSQGLMAINTAATNASIVKRDTGGVINVGTPTADTHAATKAYVDSAVSGIDIPTVTVDSAMSASSTNPVQNKVVKTYVDNAVAAKAPAYSYGTSDKTPGSSSLTTGTLYFVYE